MSAALLEVTDLRLGFAAAGSTVLAVEGVSFRIGAGETFALLGESGCGKSATAQGVMRLLPAAGRIVGGTVRLGGEELLALPEAAMRGLRGCLLYTSPSPRD